MCGAVGRAQHTPPWVCTKQRGASLDPRAPCDGTLGDGEHPLMLLLQMEGGRAVMEPVWTARPMFQPRSVCGL